MFDGIIKQMNDRKEKINIKTNDYLYFLWEGEEVAYIGHGTTMDSIIKTHREMGRNYSHCSKISIHDLPIEAEEICIQSIFKCSPKYNNVIKSDYYKTLTTIRGKIREKYPQYKYDSRFYVTKLRKALSQLGVDVYYFKAKEFYDLRDFEEDDLINVCLCMK